MLQGLLGTILMRLLDPTHLAGLTADAVGEYATIAHGEGGVGKVLAGAEGLVKLLRDAVGPDTTAPTLPLTPPPSAPAA